MDLVFLAAMIGLCAVTCAFAAGCAKLGAK
jgi:hypothetical protein